MSPKRPIMRYHGGKWKLAPWIISHFPEHRTYVEPFGGAASVLLRKPRSYAEVYNDLDAEVVNVFRVARDSGNELREKLYLTPFAREEFKEAYQPSDCPLEQARRTVIRSFMGFGSSAVTKTRKTTSRFNNPNTGFRANSNRSSTTPAHDWKNYAESLDALLDRLRGVVIENRDALEVMKQHDTEQTLHYVDPPYVASTRDAGSDYRYELGDLEHENLLESLKALKGYVILSGYPNALYDEKLEGWTRLEKSAHTDGASPRIEVIWVNPQASATLAQGSLL